jgi:hypothetical protein
MTNEHPPDETQDTTGMQSGPAKKPLPKSKQTPKAPPLKTLIEERRYELTFIRELLAMSPSSKTIYSDFIASKAPTQEHAEEELETIPDAAKGAKHMTVFHRDAEGVYLLNYQIKGFLKAAAGALRPIYEISNLRSKIVAYVFVAPRYIWLAENNAGQIERPLPTGRTGVDGTEQMCLSSSEYVPAGTKVQITIRKLPHAHVTWEVVEGCLDYGEVLGIGAWRGAEFGTFTWERMNGT